MNHESTKVRKREKLRNSSDCRAGRVRSIVPAYPLFDYFSDRVFVLSCFRDSSACASMSPGSGLRFGFLASDGVFLGRKLGRN
jgi:hypothetical protein